MSGVARRKILRYRGSVSERIKRTTEVDVTRWLAANLGRSTLSSRTPPGAPSALLRTRGDFAGTSFGDDAGRGAEGIPGTVTVAGVGRSTVGVGSRGLKREEPDATATRRRPLRSRESMRSMKLSIPKSGCQSGWVVSRGNCVRHDALPARHCSKAVTKSSAHVRAVVLSTAARNPACRRRRSSKGILRARSRSRAIPSTW